MAINISPALVRKRGTEKLSLVQVHELSQNEEKVQAILDNIEAERQSAIAARQEAEAAQAKAKAAEVDIVDATARLVAWEGGLRKREEEVAGRISVIYQVREKLFGAKPNEAMA